MATYADDKIEGLSGNAIHSPYVTRDGDVAAPAFVSFQRGGPAVLKGTGPATTTAVGCVSDSAEALTLSTQKIHSFRNEGVEKAYIDANGLLFGPGTMVPSYGGTYEYNESGSAIALTTSTEFYRWITGQAGTVKGTGYVTWDNAAAPTGKRLTIGANGAGVYLVMATFSGNLTKKGDLEGVVYVNADIQNNIRSDQKAIDDLQYLAGAVTGIVTLAAGDTVTLWFGSSVNTNTFTIKHANITLQRVG